MSCRHEQLFLFSFFEFLLLFCGPKTKTKPENNIRTGKITTTTTIITKLLEKIYKKTTIFGNKTSNKVKTKNNKRKIKRKKESYREKKIICKVYVFTDKNKTKQIVRK